MKVQVQVNENEISLEELNKLEEKLLPCPFCGGKARLLRALNGVDSYSVFCSDCFVFTCQWGGQGIKYAGAKLAMKHWNCRNNDKCRLK